MSSAPALEPGGSRPKHAGGLQEFAYVPEPDSTALFVGCSCHVTQQGRARWGCVWDLVQLKCKLCQNQSPWVLVMADGRAARVCLVRLAQPLRSRFSAGLANEVCRTVLDSSLVFMSPGFLRDHREVQTTLNHEFDSRLIRWLWRRRPQTVSIHGLSKRRKTRCMVCRGIALFVWGTPP